MWFLKILTSISLSISLPSCLEILKKIFLAKQFAFHTHLTLNYQANLPPTTATTRTEGRSGRRWGEKQLSSRYMIFIKCFWQTFSLFPLTLGRLVFFYLFLFFCVCLCNKWISTRRRAWLMNADLEIPCSEKYQNEINSFFIELTRYD